MPIESDDPDTAFTAQIFLPLFAQVVWKETTKVWICRLSTNHAKLSAHFGMHWRWRPRPQPSGPAQLQRRSQSTFTSKSFTSTLTASTVQVGCGTTLCPGSAALFLPTAYGLSVVCHYSPQARSQMGARLVPCAPVCFCTSMRPEPCCSASLSVWDGRFRTPPRSAPCHV